MTLVAVSHRYVALLGRGVTPMSIAEFNAFVKQSRDVGKCSARCFKCASSSLAAGKAAVAAQKERRAGRCASACDRTTACACLLI